MYEQFFMDSGDKYDYFYFNSSVMYRVTKVVRIETAIGVKTLLRRKDRKRRTPNS